MMPVDPAAVRAVVQKYVTQLSTGDETAPRLELADDFDLYLSGVIDSLGFLGLISTIQDTFGADIDFDDLDPDKMTIVGSLCRFVAERAKAP